MNKGFTSNQEAKSGTKLEKRLETKGVSLLNAANS